MYVAPVSGSELYFLESATLVWRATGYFDLDPEIYVTDLYPVPLPCQSYFVAINCY